jgi:hypothetical protein
MLGRQSHKLIARAFKTQHPALICEVCPFPSDSPDENSATRTVRCFIAAELIFRDAVAVEVDGGSVIVGATGPGIAF